MKSWIKLLNRECSLAFQAEVPLVNRDLLPQDIGCLINCFWCESITYGVFYKNSELKKLAEAIKAKIKTDSSFAKNNIADCYRLGNILLKRSVMPSPLVLATATDSHLLHSLNQFREAYLNFLPYLVYPHSIERYFIKQISLILKKHLATLNRKSDYHRIYEIFTTPAVYEIDEQIDLLTLAQIIRSEGWNQKNEALIVKLKNKYNWQPFWTISAKPLTTAYFRNAVQAYVDSKVDLANEIRHLKKGQKDRQKQLNQALLEIRATDSLKAYVELLQAYMYLRTYRKNIISQAHYLHLPLLLEIGRRMEIGHGVLYITYEEMISYLNHGSRINHKVINQRIKAWGVLSVGTNIAIIAGKKSVKATAKKYQIEDIQPQKLNGIVKGQPACLGRAIGHAKIITKNSEFGKINQGDILIAPMTTPDYVPIMKKVSAIITDEGGVTCHAAIVSREFNLPCIVGTRNATKVFKDGDLIEVNAKTGIAKII